MESSIPIWLIELLIFLSGAGLSAVLCRLLCRSRKIRKQNTGLRQEREVIFDFIHNIGEVFADAEEIHLESLLKRILFFATKTGKSASGVIYLYSEDRTKLFARAVSGIFPPLYDAEQVRTEQMLAKSQYLETLVKTRPVASGEGLIGSSAAVGSGIIIEDAEIDARVPNYTDAFMKIHSLLIVPMRFGNEVLGVIALANRTDGQPFTAGDLNLLQAMADQASVPVHYAGLKADLDRKRQLDRDMQTAQQIQMSLLPLQLPKIEGVRLAACNLSAFNIGGDYYDVIQIDKEHLGIAIADVSGKGIGGAMMMAVCQGVLRARAPQEKSPARMLSELNRVLSANLAEDMFITMLYMVFNIRTRELKVARAGHERPLIKRAHQGSPEALDASGIAIGLADAEIFDGAIQDVSVQLEPGDVVVVYTDGVTEALNERNEEWGTNNLLQTINDESASGVDALIGAIRSRLARHVGAQQQHDDITLVALEVH
ncbi:MAG: SpoIIE family protein phosphatase [Verrucomicrobia bacterium]|nr:SpoIIE family protein phosphatase [Verrucomicrobiota bacterium]